MRLRHAQHSFAASFVYALRGVGAVFMREVNFRRQVYIGVLVLCAAAFFRISLSHTLLLLIVIALVFITEMCNTALEYIADMVHPEYHDDIRRSKDIAAGAVVVASIVSVVVGLVIFIPHILELVTDVSFKVQ